MQTDLCTHLYQALISLRKQNFTISMSKGGNNSGFEIINNTISLIVSINTSDSWVSSITLGLPWFFIDFDPDEQANLNVAADDDDVRFA